MASGGSPNFVAGAWSKSRRTIRVWSIRFIVPTIHARWPKKWVYRVPKEDMKKETLFDGVEFDPSKPEEYAKKFLHQQHRVEVDNDQTN